MNLNHNLLFNADLLILCVFVIFLQNIVYEFERNHPHIGKGFAYIEYSSPDEAETAMKHMDGGQIDGQVIYEIEYLILIGYYVLGIQYIIIVLQNLT